jgi:hypothetical protein
MAHSYLIFWLFELIFGEILKSEILYRYLTAVIMLAAFVAQTFSNSFIIADYYANTSKYAAHCENKDKPKMHCNGRCQMMKKLRQEEKKNQDKRSENRNEILFSVKLYFVAAFSVRFTASESIETFPSSTGKSSDRSFDIFHPPKA